MAVVGNEFFDPKLYKSSSSGVYSEARILLGR